MRLREVKLACAQYMENISERSGAAGNDRESQSSAMLSSPSAGGMRFAGNYAQRGSPGEALHVPVVYCIKTHPGLKTGHTLLVVRYSYLRLMSVFAKSWGFGRDEDREYCDAARTFACGTLLRIVIC